MEKGELTTDGLVACRNCGAPLTSKFCAACGEKRFVPGEHSIKHFMGDIVRELTFLDSRFLYTFRLMVTNPGSLSYQYINGRRVSFVKPLSMFFIANLIYFLFPLYSTLNTPLNVQMQHMPYSSIAERMVTQRLKEDKIPLKTFEVAYAQQSTNMAKLILFLMVLYFSVPLALVNYSKELYFYDHLMVALEFFSLVVICVFLGIHWSTYFLCWIVALAGGDIWFIMADSVISWVIVVAIIYLLYRIGRSAYGMSAYRALMKAAILVACFVVVLQLYRASLFFITFWTM